MIGMRKYPRSGKSGKITHLLSLLLAVALLLGAFGGCDARTRVQSDAGVIIM